MPAITIIIFEQGGHVIESGSLYRCDPELLTPSRVRKYSESRVGWAVDDLGYSFYNQSDSLGRRICVPGVRDIDGKSPRRGLNLGMKFSRKQIEEFLRPHLSIADNVKNAADKEYGNLTHDLRAISSELYNAAIDAIDLLGRNEFSEVRNKLETVKAAQQLMSLRLDVIDYNRGVSQSIKSKDIPVYRRIDKVFKCFQGKADHLDIDMSMSGRSVGHSFGPEILEIIPLVVIENALKYAPKSTAVPINLSEDSDEISARISSYGPKIDEDELEKIFEKDYRGRYASSSRAIGSGIGLFAAKSIIEESFGGSISVVQNSFPIKFGKDEYYYTTFTLKFPRFFRDR